MRPLRKGKRGLRYVRQEPLFAWRRSAAAAWHDHAVLCRFANCEIAPGYDALRGEDIAAVLAAYPRLNLKEESIATVLHICEKKPQGVALTAFSEVGRKYLPSFPAPTLDVLFHAAPFAE